MQENSKAVSEKTKKSRFARKIWETRNFGLILGFVVFLFLSWVAFLSGLDFFDRWDKSLTDIYFRFRTLIVPQIKQEGAVIKANNDQISPDILILGVDDRSLDNLGRWPFPRSVHADFLNSFSRITKPTERESSVFFDFFFLDKDRQVENDVAFQSAIKENQRVFLETIYQPQPMDPDDAAVQFHRLDLLLKNSGKLLNVSGPWENMASNETVQAPLIPFADSSAGNGHASFLPDEDKVFRRQNLVAKITQIVEEIPFQDLKPDTSDYRGHFQRYVWSRKDGAKITIQAPLTDQVIKALASELKADGLTRQVAVGDTDQVQDIYVIQKVQDYFLPSITLSLALNYWHKTVKDVQVVLGSQIVIPNPEIFHSESGKWEPYDVPGADKKRGGDNSVRIPIDDQAAMAINFMGPRSSENGNEYQTFPIRSYSSYVSKAPSPDRATWRESREVANKILMAGPFASGVADDEKNTPYGQMFGVEIHANALNTILMNRFLTPVPVPFVAGLLFLFIAIIAFLASRTPTFLSLAVTFLLFVVSLLGVTIFFDLYALVVPFSVLGTGILVTFVVVIVYRALTEEKDKQKIRSMFGKYVSPDVVSQILEHPPELGGVDKELTVLFSDIRGFTTLSEGMTPQELVNHLNVYLTAMTDVILMYQGTLDKYVGDEVMCFWGAPLEQKDHAILASKCALKMMEELNRLNSQWPESRKINIGIGLNSGVMTVGNMGSLGRMNYTLMGDNVNLGARLEGTNKEYMTNVIISEYTYSYIKETAVVRELDNIRVKGKNKPVLIYELLDFTDGIDPPSLKKR